MRSQLESHKRHVSQNLDQMKKQFLDFGDEAETLGPERKQDEPQNVAMGLPSMGFEVS